MILPIAMTRIDFDLVDLNQVSGRITDCRVDPEAFNVLLLPLGLIMDDDAIMVINSLLVYPL